MFRLNYCAQLPPRVSFDAYYWRKHYCKTHIIFSLLQCFIQIMGTGGFFLLPCAFTLRRSTSKAGTRVRGHGSHCLSFIWLPEICLRKKRRCETNKTSPPPFAKHTKEKKKRANWRLVLRHVSQRWICRKGLAVISTITVLNNSLSLFRLQRTPVLTTLYLD